MKKLLVICSTLNLEYPYNATPAIWQLLKGLCEVGCEIIAIPYRGAALRSLWWRCYENPCKLEGELYSFLSETFRKMYSFKPLPNRNYEKIVSRFANMLNNAKWIPQLERVFRLEKDIDALVIIGVPLNQIGGIASHIKREYDIPVIYYDLDVPTSFPEYRGFSFNYYQGADLSEYNAFLIPSEGSSSRLFELGAQKVFILHFGVDPEVYAPINCAQNIDVFYFARARASLNRESSIEMMIAKPSEILPYKFVVGGTGFSSKVGRAIQIPNIQFSEWRNYSCRTKVNLNIPRENHAKTYATSTSRPFELAAMGCCIVSSPYHGLEKWFEIGKEILVAESVDEAVDFYQLLLEDEEFRAKVGQSARQRVLKQHTHKHRAQELLSILNSKI